MSDGLRYDWIVTRDATKLQCPDTTGNNPHHQIPVVKQGFVHKCMIQNAGPLRKQVCATVHVLASLLVSSLCQSHDCFHIMKMTSECFPSARDAFPCVCKALRNGGSARNSAHGEEVPQKVETAELVAGA